MPRQTGVAALVILAGLGAVIVWRAWTLAPPPTEREADLTRSPPVAVRIGGGRQAVVTGGGGRLALIWPDGRRREARGPATFIAGQEFYLELGREREVLDPGARIRLRPLGEAILALDGKRYRGEFLVRYLGPERLAVTNRLPLELYLAGVVGAEMSPRFPPAALEAQAVAARTYALCQLARRRRQGRAELRADQSDQVYGGVAREDQRVWAAIRDTCGVVLTWRGELFPSYYAAACGDRTVGADSVFGEAGLAPLAGVECGQCREAPHYRWEALVSDRRLLQVLDEAGLEAGAVDGWKLEEPAGPGRRRQAVLETDAGEQRLPAYRLRRLLGEERVRSTAFEAERAEWATKQGPVSGWRLRGGGWGHRVGLCQHGAVALARRGRNWREILAYYYPGAEPVRLRYSPEAGKGEGE